MDFVKCKLCRAPFFSYGSRLCQDCQERMDKDFITVRDYIYDNPNEASVEKIAEATGVDEKSIIYLLEEDRFAIKGALETSALLRCQICGRNISSGSICESCKISLTKDLGAAVNALNDEKKSVKSTVSRTRGNRETTLMSEYSKKSKN
ncbi:MAG: flagellar protein [Firmicutes bacterium]|nr:flagellar protein [Bacillota bacterium]